MSALPVKELRFGGLIFPGQEATFRLGRLSCNGRKVKVAQIYVPNKILTCTLAAAPAVCSSSLRNNLDTFLEGVLTEVAFNILNSFPPVTYFHSDSLRNFQRTQSPFRTLIRGYYTYECFRRWKKRFSGESQNFTSVKENYQRVR
jgi:hypothetical protein